MLRLRHIQLAIKEPRKFARKLVHKCPGYVLKNRMMGFPANSHIHSQLAGLVEQYRGKSIFVFPSPGCPWGYMFQRPQQLARALSAAGYPVIYCVDTSFPEDPDWSVRGLIKLEDSIYLYNDGVHGEALSTIADHLMIWQFWPHQSSFVQRIKSNRTKLIYDYIDHLTTFIPYSGLHEDFESSLRNADLVLVTADYLLEDLQNYEVNRWLLVPNGVHQDDFAVLRSDKKYNDFYAQLNQLRGTSDVIVGYYGALAEWVDFELLEYCALKNPDWTFLMVGQCYPDITPPNIPNLHIWERVSYELIPHLLNIFDIAIVPFKINEITLHTSPVKIFEYMAGGKPVVSTNLPEVRKYEPVLIGTTTEQFERKLHAALEYKNDESYMKSLETCASSNTWAHRVEVVINELKERDLLSG